MGNMSGSYGSHYTLRLNAYTLSQDTSANTSTIRADLYLDFDGSSYYAYTHNTTSGSITINGNTANKSVSSIDFSSGVASSVYLGTHDVTVAHNTDGTCGAISVSGSWNTNTTRIGSGSTSTTVTPSTIPRYASITTFKVDKWSETSVKVTWGADAACDSIWYSTNNGSSWTGTSGYPNFYITGLSANTSYNFKIKVRRTDSQLTTISGTVSQTTYNYPYITAVQTGALVIGNSQKLTLYNPLSRSVTIKMRKNNSSGTELYSGTTSGTTITFTPTASTLYASIPSAQSSNCVYTATYSGHTATTNTYSYKVAGTETPTFSTFTYRDSNSTTSTLTGNDQVLIKGKSTLEVTISSANKMVAKNSATAKSYNITCDTKTASPNYSDNDVISTLGTIDNSGTKRLTVTAYDSRNLSTSAYQDINVYDYSKPVINATVTRLNNFENETTLSVSGTYSQLTIDSIDKNAMQQVQYRYRETGGDWESYATMVMTASNGTYSCTDVVLNLDNTKSFEFEIIATDSLDSNTRVATLGVGQAILFINKDGGIDVKGYVDATGYYSTIADFKVLPTGQDSRDYWAGLPNGWYWYGDTGAVPNMPVSWAWIYKGGYITNGDFNVLCFQQSSGDIYRKSGNYNGISGWVRISWKDSDNRALWNRYDGTRPTSANFAVEGDGKVTHFLATSSMTTGKPQTDANILKLNWDYDNGYDKELAIINHAKPWLQVRAQNGSATWNPWMSIQSCRQLYYNSSGNAGTVTLNESASNFDYIEIFYWANRESKSWFDSIKVTGGIKYFTMTSIIGNASDYTTAKGSYGTGYINGTSITRGANGYGQFEWSAGSTVAANSVNCYWIYKVLGYAGGTA